MSPARTMTWGLSVFTFLALAVPITAHAALIGIDDFEFARSVVSVSCNGNTSTEVRTQGADLTCEAGRIIRDFGADSALAEAMSEFGDLPIAYAAVALSGSGGHPTTTGSADTLVSYQFGISNLHAPPILDIPSLPTTGSIASDVVIVGDGSYAGTAIVTLEGAGLPVGGLDLGVAPPNFDQVVSLDLVPEEIYTVTMEANCEGSFVGNGEGFCEVSVDPIIAFDQAVFDARMGPNTFQLADFFGFIFSPNLLSISEPSTVFLFGIGLLGFCLIRRRRAIAPALSSRPIVLRTRP